MNRNRVTIIAEAGVNHNGSLLRAKQMIDVAVRAGADAIKFQTFRAEELATAKTPKALYQQKNCTQGAGQLEMLKSLELGEHAHRELFRYCQRRNIEFLSTPFDQKSLAFLVRLGVQRLKISSGEITNGPLLLAAARTQLPIILSTGMATLREVENALAIMAFGYRYPAPKTPDLVKARSALWRPQGQKSLQRKVVLLHCTTEYPTIASDVNLLAMATLEKHFGCAVGFSDHSEGLTAAIASVALGASVVEKHFTLDRGLSGPDHKSSLVPRELLELVRSIRRTETLLGDGRKRPAKSEIKNIPVVRKTLVAAVPIQKGETFTEKNVTAKRAGTRVSPMRFWTILGQKAKYDLRQDEVIRL